MTQPITYEIIRDTFRDKVDRFVDGEVFHKGTIVGILKKACGSDSRYRQVLKGLTGRTSSKELNEAQWYALYTFVKPVKPEGGKWQSEHGDEKLASWCDAVVRHMDAQPGQETFLTNTAVELGGVERKNEI